MEGKNMKKRVSIFLAVIFCALMLASHTAHAGYYIDHGTKRYFVPETMEDLENAGFVENLYDPTYLERLHGHASQPIRLTDKVGTAFMGDGWFDTGDEIWLKVLTANSHHEGEAVVWDAFGPAASTAYVKEQIVPDSTTGNTFAAKASFCVDSFHFKSVKVGDNVIAPGEMVAAGTGVTVELKDDYRHTFEAKKGPDELKVWGPKALMTLSLDKKASIESKPIAADAEGDDYMDGVYAITPLSANFTLQLKGENIVGDQYSQPLSAYTRDVKKNLRYKTGDALPCAPQLLLVFSKVAITATMSKDDVLRTLADNVIADGEAATILKVGRGFTYEAGTIKVVELLSDDASKVMGDVLPGDFVGAMKVVKLYWTERSEYHDPNPAPSDPPTPPSEYHC